MVGNCQTCGALALLVRGNCPRCLRQEDELFETVRGILRREPGLGVDEVSEKSGAKTETILRLIAEGRLLLKEGLLCGACRKPISSGRFCPDCLKRLGQGLGVDTSGKRQEGMYTRMKEDAVGRKGEERRK